MAKLMNKLVDSFGQDDAPDAGCVRAVLAELVLTFLFVFTGVSAAMAAGTSMHASADARPSLFRSIFLFFFFLKSKKRKETSLPDFLVWPLPGRLGRSRREARRGYADGDAGRGGHRARVGGGGAGDCGVSRLRRPPEPGGDGGAHGARTHHQAPGGAVRRGAAAGRLPRLHPPPLPHQRHGDPGARLGRGHQPNAGPGDGGDPHLLPALRHLRHDPRPTEPGPHHRPAAHRPHRRRQQPRWWQLHRCIHEPSPIVRPSPGQRDLDQPLDLLGRPPARWVLCRVGVRVAILGQQDARAATQRRHLTIRNSEK